MKLIIAEKPSLARNIADGIAGSDASTAFRRRDGYLESSEYLITWAFGHLFSLADVEDYGPGGDPLPPPARPAEADRGATAPSAPRPTARWTLEGLPCFPKQFRFVLRNGKDGERDAGVMKQFMTIRTLCRRPDVDTVINAGDADREGEIIVRLCILKSGCPGKRLMRLWLPDQTPETVRAALADLKEEKEYDRLANEGFARTYIDWLYGINLTRYATVKSGKLLRVGRVVVPIVKAIYQRDREIEEFVPKDYFALVSNEETHGEPVELVSKKQFDGDRKDKAQALCDTYNEAEARVIHVKKKKDTLAPGKLYSLSKLQSYLGKKYKMSMGDSLAIVQKLYEEGYLTYPRTNSEYLATAEKDKIARILEQCRSMGYPVTLKTTKKIFDDSKIESHSAITPTYKIPSKDRLTPREYQVYSAVFRRFIAVFCSQECKVEKSEIQIDVGGYEIFTLKGTVLLEPGWTKYDDYTAKDKILPKLAVGDLVEHLFRPVVKKTTPPKHYTIETLNNYLKNPFREEKAAAEDMEADDAEEYRAVFEGLELGTEATRTGIIDNARASGYILLNNNVYTILPDGRYLIETLEKLQISMDKYKTAELGKALKKVYRGEMQVSESVTLAQQEIAQVFSHRNLRLERSFTAPTEKVFEGEAVGDCPLCRRKVRPLRGGWSCESKDCPFILYNTVLRHAITPEELSLLLAGEKTGYAQDFISKSGKPFTARLYWQGGRLRFEFPTK